MFKFDEQQTCLQQRKDSASSEVAALLCISGRTSRISSVGSQGSAVSRLSAMSGVSRSPSPHKLHLETSFCGPKPLDNIVPGGLVSSSDPPNVEILEQVLLARKHDPTQVIMAEGVHIDTSTPKKVKNAAKPVGNGNVAEHAVGNVEKPIKPKPAVPSTRLGKGGGVLKASSKPIVGKTSSGLEYIRIKLKPDHLYSDKGLAANERVLEDTTDAVKKPASLSLGKDTPSKKAAPHFSQLVKSDDAITKHPDQVPPSASPKTVRHIGLRDSRSPSPGEMLKKIFLVALFYNVFYTMIRVKCSKDLYDFKCPYCSQSAKCLDSLNTHLRTHVSQYRDQKHLKEIFVTFPSGVTVHYIQCVSCPSFYDDRHTRHMVKCVQKNRVISDTMKLRSNKKSFVNGENFMRTTFGENSYYPI